ncbi:hypothetical protein MKW92_034063 [Papaver armeniacum]|nr:hypothetical protein MKW92_034063 [Papaver armeniacum]
MDFMKVLDQAVREIKREVNIKLLKVPEMEQKVLDATSDEPWGPHGTDLTEIAQATKKITECQMVMNVLWSRLSDRNGNWRYVYKALTVIEYLVANGSERALDDIIGHTFAISKKVETLTALLHDNNKIQEVRNKAAANRDKYVGLSSSGMTYKSSSAGYGSSSFQQSDRCGGFGNKRDGEMFKDSYRDRDRLGGEESGKKPMLISLHRHLLFLHLLLLQWIFFAAPDPAPPTDSKPAKSEPMSSSTVDPFAAIPVNNFDGGDMFGDFTSNTNQQVPSQAANNSTTDSILNSQSPSVESKLPKKNSFQVKSGIWADSLSRGLIDLNITAPTPAKTNLADIGIVGGLGDMSDETKGAQTSHYMGRAMGAGSGYGMAGSGYGTSSSGSGMSGFTSTGTGSVNDDDFFSSLSQPQTYGSFQK